MSRHIVSPWELEVLQRNLEDLLDAIARTPETPSQGWLPLVDLVDRPDAYVVRVDVPGVRRGDLEIALLERELRISGVKGPGEPGGEACRCHRVERSFGPFSLHLHLPVPVDPQRSRAVLRHGVLEVTLERLHPRRPGPHVIEVTEEEP